MKHEKISIKWKIFMYLLVFILILLVILWLVQICYLDSFYKYIKTRESEGVMTEAVTILQSSREEDKKSSLLDELAAKNSMALLVTDSQGTNVYSAEYIPNSRLSAIPEEVFLKYYAQAKENEGAAKIVFKGNKNQDFPDSEPEPRHERREEAGNGEFNGEGKPDFFQNHGQERAESLIYVRLVESGEEELVLFLNCLLTPVDATVRTLKVELVSISLFMLVFSLLLAFLISRKISKSIIRVNHSAKKLAEGDFDVTFEGRDYREIAQLSDTLNFAASELGKTESLRQELLANVSHDLRTPLTMIIAYSEVMRDLPGENTPENIQVVIDESERLANLVNDMLDISKLQAGVMEKNASVYNITNSISSVMERYHKLKEQDGYQITFFYDRDAFVKADEYKMFQVIYNLVNNAINYTGEDKAVNVRQILRDGKVRIEVSDTGEGIEQEALPYVWDRYYKVDKSHKRAVMGTGLGLSIVKNILILHQAEYGVETEKGRGSIFWFELEEVKSPKG